MKVTKELIGKRIKTLLEDHEPPMKLKQLSNKSGVGLSVIKNTVSENQTDRTLSKIDDLLRIAHSLDVSPFYLLTEIEDENYVVCEELGLSNDTVNKLKKKSTSHLPYMQKAIDYLVSYPPALLMIYHYLTEDFQAIETPNRHLSANDLERVDRLSVLDELEVLRVKVKGAENFETSKR